jgi:pimeloyl-ACP methyl ester carboxylesterase
MKCRRSLGRAVLGQLCSEELRFEARVAAIWLRRFGWLLGVTLVLLCNCTSPLSVRQLDTHEGYNRLNRSALSGDILSDPTLITLRRHGLFPLWNRDPTAAIARLRADVVETPSLWPELFALAELSYFQGERAMSRPEFLSAAIYAYAYLFPSGTGDRPSPYDQRFRQACDIYNLGLTAAFTPPGGGPVQLVSGRHQIPSGTIDLEVDQDQFRWAGRTLVSFQPTSNLVVEGIQNVYRSPGLGAPLAALTETGSASAKGFEVAPKLRVPTNMLLTMEAPRQQLTGSELRAKLLIHTIFDEQDTRIGNQTVPLEYDETAARALSLVEASAWRNEYWGFLNGGLFDQSPDQLVALQPHQRGRMPVILVHGTASSPFRWADMVNDLLEDPAIRDHFEFWFFSYATGNPIPYSAFQLRRSIEAAVRQLGGTTADPALGRITVIGHSQGGLLAKMLVIDPGDRLWTGVSGKPFASVNMTDKSRELLRETLFPTPLPDVQRVVFIATPQRGSYAAAFSISQLIGRLVTLPASVAQASADVLSGNGSNVLVDPSHTRLGSVYGMSPSSRFIKALAAVPVVPGVHTHSIIPVQTDGPIAEGSDGVVRYASAHIDDVDSELIVRSGHSTQSNPATIAEVRRILLLQLAASGSIAATTQY